MNKIFILTLLFLTAKSSISQNWDKIDLFDKNNTPISFASSSTPQFAQKNDSVVLVSASFTNNTPSLKLAEVNLSTGKVTILDTNNKTGILIYFAKNKIFGAGVKGLFTYNLTTNKWDSIAPIKADGGTKDYFVKMTDDTLLLLSDKIYKFNVNTHIYRKVSDIFLYYSTIEITSKDYFAILINGSYTLDSTFLLVSSDRGENWSTRRRLNGNYTYDNFRCFFVNKDTGFVSYENKAGSSSRQCHVLRTKDGGMTWPDTIKYFQQALGSIWGVNEIYFLDRNIGFVSYGSSIFKTIDGGNTWYETMGVNTDGVKMFFINDTVGFAMNGRYYPSQAKYILKTTTQGGPPFKKVGSAGINKLEAAITNAKVFPNPNKGEFTVTIPGLTITGIQVYDNNSKLIFDEVYNDGMQNQKIIIQGIAAGIYYVHISTKEVPKVFTKFVVE